MEPGIASGRKGGAAGACGCGGSILKSYPLSGRLRERSTAVEWLRLFAATIVVLFHCFALNRLWASDPLRVLLPGLELGSLGVQIFFFLSGLLVAQSYANHRSIIKFSIARILRLYPALVAATLFTVAAGALSTSLDLASFLSSSETRTFIFRRALGLVTFDGLPGAFVHNPFPVAVNGSLWTLPIEIKMYIAVAIIGLTGLLHRKWLFTASVMGVIALFSAFPGTFPISPDFRGTRAIVLMFALGSLSFVWRERIPVSAPIAAACVALLIASEGARTQLIASAVLVSYIVLTLGYHPFVQNRLPSLRADLSYGIYVYSFPIQQTIIERWSNHFAGNPWTLFPVAMLLVVPIAALSWFALEKPALRMKVK